MNSFHSWDSGPGGLLLGFGGGYVLMKSRFPFAAGNFAESTGTNAAGGPAESTGETTAKEYKKFIIPLLRYVLGMTGLGFFAIVLKKLLPGEESIHYQLARFFRYGVLGFWISAAAPALFIRLRLAGFSDSKASD
jgi:hypothetical protein